MPQPFAFGWPKKERSDLVPLDAFFASSAFFSSRATLALALRADRQGGLPVDASATTRDGVRRQ